MDCNERESTATEFMLTEYQDLYQNIMHLENKLFSHISFYTTLFTGIATASIAILQLGKDTSSSLVPPEVLASLSPLFLLFLIVGRFELRMTTELRIRKMKFVEGITQIRQYFVDQDESIADYLVLPVGLQKAPPYLRVRSKDWYQVIYMSFVNGLVAFIAWMCPVWFLRTRLIQAMPWVPVKLVVPSWLFIGMVLAFLMFWMWSYRSVMDFCESYDKRREKRIGGESEYDLFERPMPKSWLKRTFGDWVVWWTEHRKRAK